MSLVGIDDAPEITDTGLSSLVLLLRFHGIGADVRQVAHQFGPDGIKIQDMLRCARSFGLKARAINSKWDRLAATPLPAIAALRNGTFLLLGAADEDKAIILSAASSSPSVMPRVDFEAAWTGQLVLAARRAALTSLSQRFDITWFLDAIKKYRHEFRDVLIASFFLQVFALVSPLFFQVVIDKVLLHHSLSTLEVLSVGLLAIASFELITGAFRTYLFAHTTNRIDVELGARLFRHLLALPINYFQSRRVGDSVARVRELENIRNFLTSAALTLIIDLFFTVIFIAVMLFYSATLTFVVLATLPIYICISAAVTPLFRVRLHEKFQRGADNQAFLVESVAGIETLKSMAVEPQMQRRWEQQLAGYVAASFRVTTLANFANQSVQYVNKIATVAVLYLGARLVIRGYMTVGELVAFNMLAARVSAPVLRLAQMWQDFHQARISVARLGDILNTPAELIHHATRSALPEMRGQIVFDHVSFRYRIDGPEILSDISFVVPAGHVIGISGRSGSGKSTLTKLVQRMYMPERGRVLVDGNDIAMIDPTWLRRQMGVVLQDSVLFNATVRENIALADPGATIERIVAAAKLAGAHDFVLELSEGYDTLIGERGSSLSGGQRQRLAIARALLSDPRLLILDEATSALDYESERAIQANMRKIAEGRTVLIVAHRLSALRMASRIISLEHGRLVEDGSHDELVKTGGHYASLFRAQAGFHEVG